MGSRQNPSAAVSLPTTVPTIGQTDNVDVQPGPVPPLPRGDAPTDATVQSLQATVDTLRGEILRLSSANEAQLKRITALTARSSTAEDFGEEVDPRALSRVVLDLAPIPKQPSAEAAADLRTADSIRLLPSLSKRQKSLLEKGDVHTLGDFISAGTRARSAVELSALLRMDREKLAASVWQAELLTLPGISAEMLPALASAGAKDAAALAGLAPEALCERLAKLSSPVTLPLEQAARWIQAAKQLAARRG